MKRMYKTLCMFVIALLSIGFTTTFAASWYFVTANSDGSELYYIDNASVTKNNYRAFVWIKNVKPDSRINLGRFYITHSPKTMALTSYVDYDSNGNVIDSGTIPIKMQQSILIAPDSVAEAIWYCIWPN